MTIPIIDLKAQFRSIEPEIRAAIDRVLADQHFILGEEVRAFETACAAFLGVRHAVGVASGSDALLVALMALGVGPGDTVVTTPMSFIATAMTISRLGAKPRFVDVDPGDLNLCPDALERLLASPGSERCKAIIPVHLYGRPCRIDRVLEVARAHEIPVVEDAAQALGARWGNARVGALGTIGCFSFFPSKNLGAYGDGGLVVTDRDDLANLLRLLRVHGGAQKYHHDLIGLNSRLDALQAAILGAKLPHLERWNEARRTHARAYNRELAGVDGIRTPPLDGDERFDIVHAYVIRARLRDELAQHLRNRGVQTAVHYPKPMHLQPCFASLGLAEGSYPVAEQAAAEVLALPIYPELSDAQRAEVVGEIASFFENRR